MLRGLASGVPEPDSQADCPDGRPREQEQRTADGQPRQRQTGSQAQEGRPHGGGRKVYSLAF